MMRMKSGNLSYCHKHKHKIKWRKNKMKLNKKIIGTATSLAILGLSLPIQADQLSGSQPLSTVFPDANFASYIASKLGKSVTDNVTQTDLNSIKGVEANEKGITSIEGAQYLNYSTSWSLHTNNISDLSPLSGWEHLATDPTGYTLRWLWLTNNPITDLSPIASWKGVSVYSLFLHGVPIGNDQIDNLIKIDQNLPYYIYTFGSNHIDNFAGLKGTFIESLSGYNNLINQGHSINLGTMNVEPNKPFIINNPSTYFDGTKIPVSIESVKYDGEIDAEQNIIFGEELYNEKPETLSFRVESKDKKTSVNYTVNLNYLIPAENVHVKYQDEKGRSLEEDSILSGNLGEEYTTEQKDIEGYTFKEVQGNPTGHFTDQSQTVTYIYTKNPILGRNIIARYVDENDNSISDDVVQSGNLGDEYMTEQKDITGYTFKEVQGNPTGQFTNQEQIIKYTYTKNKDSLVPNTSSISENKDKQEIVSKDKVNLGSSKTEALPKTGERNNSIYSIIGILLIFITFGATFNMRKREFNRKHKDL